MSFRIAIFSLNQWSLDFANNTARILKSIDQARDRGVIYRAGPELELCGYSLDDAFFEADTVHHCWFCIKDILDYSKNIEMIIDVGMPVQFGALYNCRLILYRGKILCIRAKTSLAKDGIYREFRHFAPWPADSGVVPFKLPSHITDGKLEYVPFGANFILEIANSGSKSNSNTSLKVGWDICQELWDVKNVSADLYHNFGCHLIVNSSGSYWELRKLDIVENMIAGITTQSGACYAFSNLVGCDGQRNVFYGRSCIYDNGRLVDMTPTRTSGLLDEVQMISYDINPCDIDSNRALMSVRADTSKSLGRVWNLQETTNDASKIDPSYRVFHLTVNFKQPCNRGPTNFGACLDPSIRFEEEIYHFVSLWLWDYLRRSGAKGFMMPLSGGLDSSTVAVLVYCMCKHLSDSRDNENVRDYFIRVHNISSDSLPDLLSSAAAICRLILRCVYISTEHSSRETENRAESLSEAVGAEYSHISIQDIYDQCRQISSPRSSGGVSLLEQNLQARLRMVMTYHLSEGNRIVLATGNVDEAIMGYLTKYDCSSADINPIGGLCKADLKSFLCFARQELFRSNQKLFDILGEIIDAPPSAELTGADQRDEDEMGITYDEISILGKVRRGKYGCSGPRGAFEFVWRQRWNQPFKTCRCFKNQASREAGDVAVELAALIKRFYQRYTRNRHKLTVLTPALHAESYSPDDNRFDHRQFLYPSMSYQFDSIDSLVDQIKRTGDIE